MKNSYLIDPARLDITSLYAEWRWLAQVTSDTVIALTKFGDAFFFGENGTVLFLDTIEATADVFASDLETFQAKLADSDVQAEVLLTDLLDDLDSAGKQLEANQLYVFTVPLMLGGKAISGNVEIYDMPVAISVTAQLSRQIKNKPEGWKPDEFVFKQRD